MSLFDDQVFSDSTKQSSRFNRQQIPVPRWFTAIRCALQHANVATEMVVKPDNQPTICIGDCKQGLWRFARSTYKRYASLAIQNASRIGCHVQRKFKWSCFSLSMRGSSGFRDVTFGVVGSITSPTIASPWKFRCDAATRANGLPRPLDFSRTPGFEAPVVCVRVNPTARQAVALGPALFSNFAFRTDGYSLSHIGYDITLGGNVKPDVSGYGWKYQERQVIGHL